MNWTHTPLALPALIFAIAAQATPNQTTDAVAPEQATGFEHKQLVKAKNWMVTAANPLATEAGASILRQGGNAIDAMVTTQLMLGLVEPRSSGIGGGSFLVYWDAKKKALTTYDGRETAPLNATPELFLDSAGQPDEILRCRCRRSLGRHTRHGKTALGNPSPIWQAGMGTPD